jgi:hypothetical protein
MAFTIEAATTNQIASLAAEHRQGDARERALTEILEEIKKSARVDSRPRRQAARRVALNLEKLEDRITPTQITVLTNSDAVQHTGTSLRDAIAQANTDAAGGISDTVVFDSSLSGTTITLGQGQLELSGAGTGMITIDGGGQITVSGNNASRVFQVDSGVQAVLAGLIIQNGTVTADYGGGIHNAGTLTVSNWKLTTSDHLLASTRPVSCPVSGQVCSVPGQSCSG